MIRTLPTGSKSAAAGITLIELLVVLAIASLTLALLPIALEGTLQSVQLKAAARELAAALRYSRGLAVRERRETLLILDVQQGYYLIEDRSGEAQSRQRALPGGLNVQLVTDQSEQLSTDRGAIRFFPDGTSSGGRITLDGDSGHYRIDVHWLSGRVQIRP